MEPLTCTTACLRVQTCLFPLASLLFFTSGVFAGGVTSPQALSACVHSGMLPACARLRSSLASWVPPSPWRLTSLFNIPWQIQLAGVSPASSSLSAVPSLSLWPLALSTSGNFPRTLISTAATLPADTGVLPRDACGLLLPLLSVSDPFCTEWSCVV